MPVRSDGNHREAKSTLDRRLLFNRQTVADLHDAGISYLVERSLDLDDARRLGNWHNCNGAGCYLLALIMAAMRHMAGHYFMRRAFHPGLGQVTIGDRRQAFPALAGLYAAFLEHFPRQDLAKATFSRGRQSQTIRRLLTGELFLLATQLDNPAATPFRKLFDDHRFSIAVDYRRIIARLDNLLQDTREEGLWRMSLTELLQAPLRAAPDNLADQIGYIRTNWAAWLPADLLSELLVGQAIAAEEAVHRGAGPGPALRPVFSRLEDGGTPAFSADTDWMANSVLIAKSIHVWLDQLSQRHGSTVRTLRDIPDEELAQLADWGFNALWLIGIWERSPASRKIKQLCGNPEAEASAYALYAYRVADELGGEEALADLESRCRHFGIRLASDVVPNHTGIDSEWMRHHPDWFLQAERPPYPAYRFSGPDLSGDPQVSIRIEDGYWNHSDAAVVFEHLDHTSGRRRYIYHGNDGTHMPWNDTAQLNFLLPDVRRAMSDLIVAIARRFRLIRFDAAMTLARKHFRRLWFPPQGGSAGVPSRSACWMSDAEFDRAFPVEFWREVVDRINREVPDTLLIAEAFWLMESYFVRTLGMHRVYNSAFMNMLKREENNKYRGILKDILAYNPEILKRYVNFMNNPDEATAVAQFGKGDKYFGVAVLLATLPGLPMFGHGQIEGLEEKYGMEYRRAYWDEQPDQGFIAHHAQVIFPLLRRRWLFSGVEHFGMYDLDTAYGVNEQVYAFSNGPAGERHLVVYNNTPHATSGRLHRAAPKAHPDSEGHPLPSSVFAVQFDLDSSKGPFCRFRDHCDGREYLRKTDDLQHGLTVHLEGYQVHVFHAFDVLPDPDGDWSRLHAELENRPVVSLDEAMLRLRFAPLWSRFQQLFDRKRLTVLSGVLKATPLVAPGSEVLHELADEVTTLAKLLLPEIAPRTQSVVYLADPLVEMTRLSDWITGLADLGMPGKIIRELWTGTREISGLSLPILTWWLLTRLRKALDLASDTDTMTILKHFGFDLAWREFFDSEEADRDRGLAILLMQTAGQSPHPALSAQTFATLVNEPTWQALLGVHQHAGETWFNRERMAALCGSLALQVSWQNACRPSGPETEESIDLALQTCRHRLARAAAVGYRLDKFLHLE